MTELEKALLHIKTRADAWAVKVVKDALSQEPTKRELERDYLLQSFVEALKVLQAENDDLKEKLKQEPCDEQRSGEWIDNYNNYGDLRHMCDQCYVVADKTYDFCPNCGARMESEE